MYRLIVLLFSLALATARHHYLSPEKSEFAELEAYNERAQRIIAAKDATIKKLMGRLQAAHFELDPTGNDPYAEFSDGHHTPPRETQDKATPGTECEAGATAAHYDPTQS